MRSRFPITVVVLAMAATTVVGWPRAEDARSSELADRVAQLELEAERDQQAETARRGGRVFARACAACHGTGGKGDGPGADDLDPPPRDLTTRQFRFRTSPSGRLPRPEELERTIRKGLPGSAMPGFGNLFSDDELSDLIGFIYSLQPETQPPWSPPEAIAIEPVPPATAEMIEEGRALYLLMACGTCHGSRGDGKGPSAAGLTDENDQPIRVTDFRYDPLKGGRTPEDIVRTLRTGLNGAPMPSYDAAMIFARDEIDPAAASTGVGPAELAALQTFLDSSPSRADLDRLDENGLAELRDSRLAALAHYVLSLDQRNGFGFRMFRQEPEREPRQQRPVKKDERVDDEDFWSQ